MIPFVRTAWTIAANYRHDPVQLVNRFQKLDEYCHAYHINEVARRASINQGKGFHRALRNGFPKFSTQFPNLEVHFKGSVHYHYAPFFGLSCFLLDIPMEIMERMFMRILLRDLTSAAARLNIIGPMEGIRIQQEFVIQMENLLKAKSQFLKDDYILRVIPFYDQEIPSQTCMMIDFLHSLHDLLYSRLFNS
jgi:urease accessory protein UreF